MSDVPTTHVESSEILTDWVCDSHQRTVDLVHDLEEDELFGPLLEIVNPLLWEIGHVAWFLERWVLRHCANQTPWKPHVDEIYNSATIPHDLRWDLPLPRLEETLEYLRNVRTRIVEFLTTTKMDAALSYFTKLSVFHTDMHTEAFTYTRQTLEMSPPRFTAGNFGSLSVKPSSERIQKYDVEIPAGVLPLGTDGNVPFYFDNEKWRHPVEIDSFRLSRTVVTQREFAEFVDDNGYLREELWCKDGWNWKTENNVTHPLYWERQSNRRWSRRIFNEWALLEADKAMVHVNWYEATAFCHWKKRRLPTEAEWEWAAIQVAEVSSDSHPRYPWGEEYPCENYANLDWNAGWVVDADTFENGDSEQGCRQMIGNVWEWTNDDFLPFDGFSIDPYKEYSKPWFGDHKVLRGGCWATRSRLIYNQYRNFYKPSRRDIWSGFRTVAVEE